MSKVFKEPRFYLCLVFFILHFLPWMSANAEASFGGFSASASEGISGFTVEFQFFTGYVAVLFPIVMIILEFIPTLNFSKKLIYLIGSLLSAVCMFISSIFAKSYGGGNEYSSVKMKWGLLFWVALVLLIAIAVITIIKDFAMNKDALKEKGIKGALSDVANQVKADASDMAGNIGNGGLSDLGAKIQDAASNIQSSVSNAGSNSNTSATGAAPAKANKPTVPCPKCGASVEVGKKFCVKCGNKMEQPTAAAPAAPAGRAKNAKKTVTENMTVREYIATLPEIECEKCGTKVATNIKFCPDCGAKMVVKVAPENCSKCNAKLIAGKKFCPDCGEPVELKELITNCKKCNAELIYGKKFCVECGTKIYDDED